MTPKKPVVVTDIDGCLVDYPGEFLRWLSKTKGLHFQSLSSLKASCSKDRYEEFKFLYRSSGVKRTLPPIPGALSALSMVISEGFDIWVVTTRPEFEPVVSDTKFWLTNNKIIFKKLIFTEDKPALIKKHLFNGIFCIIDDDLEIVQRVAIECKRQTFFFNRTQSPISNKNITPIQNWNEFCTSFKNFISNNHPHGKEKINS